MTFYDAEWGPDEACADIGNVGGGCELVMWCSRTAPHYLQFLRLLLRSAIM